MGLRTDIAVELLKDGAESDDGISVEKTDFDGIILTDVVLKSNEAASKVGKPKGRYLTFETESCFDIFYGDDFCKLLSKSFSGFFDEKGSVLVIGIGNIKATPDALGPKVAEKILATRHIENITADEIGLRGLRSVSVLSPGVLGQTGVEISEVIKGVICQINPSKIVLVDALAAGDIERLGRTVQISNTGIIPGSGVGNSRIELSRETLGVDCITVGIPTVVDAVTLCRQMTGVNCDVRENFVVTQRNIDLIIENGASIISRALNTALQPDIDPKILLSLV